MQLHAFHALVYVGIKRLLWLQRLMVISPSRGKFSRRQWRTRVWQGLSPVGSRLILLETLETLHEVMLVRYLSLIPSLVYYYVYGMYKLCILFKRRKVYSTRTSIPTLSLADDPRRV